MCCKSKSTQNFNYPSKNQLFKSSIKQFTSNEQKLIHKLYIDVASRSEQKLITKENFLNMFPFTGIWGNKLFFEFDLNHNQFIDFEQFVIGLCKLTRCSNHQKIETLFKQYDLDGDGFIDINDFRTILYNYPKDALKRVFNDKEFLLGAKIIQNQQLDQKWKDSLLKEANISKIVYQEDIELQDIPSETTKNENYNIVSNLQRDIFNLNDIQYINANASLKMSQNISNNMSYKMSDQSNYKSRSNSVQIFDDSSSVFMDSKLSYQDSQISLGTQINFQAESKIISVQHANLNFLVKQYVRYILKKFNSNKLNFIQFEQWVINHSILLKLFSETFHEEFWSYNQSKPLFLNKQTDCKGFLYKRSRKNRNKNKKYWFELREMFLYYWKNKNDQENPKLIFLEGLLIEKRSLKLDGSNTNFRYGFDIYHKDRVYKSISLFCSTESDLNEWLSHFNRFDRTSPYELYSIMEKIGQGGYSIVYRCVDKKTKEEYAMKAIEKFKLDEGQKKVLENETQIMRILNHPGIVKYQETIETKTHIYLIMELFRGGDLLEYISKNIFLEEYDANRIFKYIVETLIYLHNVGVIHRDLKPENILLAMDKQNQNVKFTKIIDFGFAKYHTKDDQEEEDDIYGTPNYVSPEILQGQNADFSADVFSLGVILFAMLRGTLPFNDMMPDMIIQKTKKGQYDITDAHWQNVSDDAKDLIQQMLQKNPKKRIKIHQIFEHPWVQNRDALLKYQGVNQKKIRRL